MIEIDQILGELKFNFGSLYSRDNAKIFRILRQVYSFSLEQTKGGGSSSETMSKMSLKKRPAE